MPFYFFYWLESTIEHLAEHEVSIEDFESIVSDPDEVTTSHSSGRPVAIGYAKDGRKLFCVYELDTDLITVLPITAYEIED
jgi:uncharacterized DUF497 family protein